MRAFLGVAILLVAGHAGATAPELLPKPEPLPSPMAAEVPAELRCDRVTGNPDAAEVEARLAHLAALYDDEVKGLHIWSWTWGGIYAAATIAQGSLAVALRGQPTSTDLAVGAVAAGVGTLSLTLLPLRFTRPMTKVRARWGESDRCALLADAEQVLEKVAPEEGTGKSWLGAVGNVAVNVALFLVLGLGYKHWTSGLISGGIGLAVGEFNLLTQPTHLAGELRRYRGLESMMLVPMFGDVNGVAVAGAF